MNPPSSFGTRVPASTARTVAVLTAVLLIWALAVLSISPDLVQGVRMVIRLTARTSLLLFLLAFTASAVWRLWPAPPTQWLLRHRRALGLAFAVSHTIHLAGIIAFARLDGAGFAQQSSLGNYLTGGLGYVFIALMAATSRDGAVRWLGTRNWQLLHTAGAYYLWLSFMVTFGKRLPMSLGYALPVMVLIAALALRWRASRRTRPAVTG